MPNSRKIPIESSAFVACLKTSRAVCLARLRLVNFPRPAIVRLVGCRLRGCRGFLRLGLVVHRHHCRFHFAVHTGRSLRICVGVGNIQGLRGRVRSFLLGLFFYRFFFGLSRSLGLLSFFVERRGLLIL